MSAGIDAKSDGTASIQVGGTDMVKIDTAGNVGVGVTPSAWSSYKALQLGYAGYVAGTNSSNELSHGSNAYNSSSGWKYINNGFAALTQSANGNHFWYTAPSGTAGNAITFTQAMTLDASGRLAVGTTTTIADNNMLVQLTASSSQERYFGVNKGSEYGIIVGYDNTANDFGFVATPNSKPLVFKTANTERARIASDGIITSTLGGMQVISGTSVSASGTAVNFTGIPSWVKKITVMLTGVSTNGTSDLLVQIGDAGGIENTGYIGTYHGLAASAVTGATLPGSGIQFNDNAASGDTRGGVLTIVQLTGNTWAFHGCLARQNGGTRNAVTSGSKSLSDTLDRVRITTAGGVNTFSAGTINILYE